MNSRRFLVPWLLIVALTVAACRRRAVPERLAVPATSRPTGTSTPTFLTDTPAPMPATPTSLPPTPTATSVPPIRAATPAPLLPTPRFRLLFGDEVPLLQDTGVQPSACRVKSVTKMTTGQAPDWSWDGRLIAYSDKIEGSNEVLVMNADGSNSRCLTCNDRIPQEFRGKHKGKATFYPNGRYLLFSVENEYGDHGIATIPGIGDNHDLWVTDLESGAYWRLTRLPEDSAIQYPRYSSDGRKLLWSQRYEKARGSIFQKGREFGFWAMKLADFSLTQDGPRLANIIDLEPGGKGYYEPHGFSPDGRQIILTAMIRPEKSAVYGEIYTLDLASNKLTNLARTDNIHYEMALYSPSGHKISFMSGPFIGVVRFGYKADLYLMDADGSNRVRLTFFNESGHPDYVGAAVQIQKEAWSPDGSKIISAYFNHKTWENRLFMITFEGPCGKL